MKRRLDVTEVIERVTNYEETMIRDVFDWLERHGGVNYGVVREKEEEKAENAATTNATNDNNNNNNNNNNNTNATNNDDKKVVDDDTIAKELVRLLKTCDMNVMTEKMIRRNSGRRNV